MVLCKYSVYERVFQFIEFNLGRIELMHIGTDSVRWRRPNRGSEDGGNDLGIALLWIAEYWLVRKALKEYTIYCSCPTFEIFLVMR